MLRPSWLNATKPQYARPWVGQDGEVLRFQTWAGFQSLPEPAPRIHQTPDTEKRMHETDEDRLKRYRREHAMWTLEGMMTWCLEHGEEKQLEALTNLEVVLNDLMVENAKLRAARAEQH